MRNERRAHGVDRTRCIRIFLFVCLTILRFHFCKRPFCLVALFTRSVHVLFLRDCYTFVLGQSFKREPRIVSHRTNNNRFRGPKHVKRSVPFFLLLFTRSFRFHFSTIIISRLFLFHRLIFESEFLLEFWVFFATNHANYNMYIYIEGIYL